VSTPSPHDDDRARESPQSCTPELWRCLRASVDLDCLELPRKEVEADVGVRDEGRTVHKHIRLTGSAAHLQRDSHRRTTDRDSWHFLKEIYHTRNG
jgi:hypothetical protein